MLGAIWAQSLDRVIGDGQGMPWHIPEDLAHFKEITYGSPVVMGRRTWQSLPEKVRPLPGRENFIVSSQPPGEWSAGAAVVDKPADVAVDAWIMGGAGLYSEAIGVVDVLEMTLIDARLAGHLATEVFAPQIPADMQLTADSGWLRSEKGKYTFPGAGSDPVRYKFIRYVR